MNIKILLAMISHLKNFISVIQSLIVESIHNLQCRKKKSKSFFLINKNNN